MEKKHHSQRFGPLNAVEFQREAVSDFRNSFRKFFPETGQMRFFGGGDIFFQQGPERFDGATKGGFWPDPPKDRRKEHQAHGRVEKGAIRSGMAEEGFRLLFWKNG